MTGSEPTPTIVSGVKNGVSEMINGIEVTWTSEQTCQANDVETNSFTAKVLCDTNIKGQGEAEVLIIDNSNECNPIVTLKHDSGCPI